MTYRDTIIFQCQFRHRLICNYKLVFAEYFSTFILGPAHHKKVIALVINTLQNFLKGHIYPSKLQIFNANPVFEYQNIDIWLYNIKNPVHNLLFHLST